MSGIQRAECEWSGRHSDSLAGELLPAALMLQFVTAVVGSRRVIAHLLYISSGSSRPRFEAESFLL